MSIQPRFNIDRLILFRHRMPTSSRHELELTNRYPIDVVSMSFLQDRYDFKLDIDHRIDVVSTLKRHRVDVAGN